MNFNAPPGVEIALLLLFPIFWSSIIAVMSYCGGWHALARRFQAEQTTFRISEADKRKRFLCASMSMGPKHFPMNYGNCLTIRVDGEGIDLNVWPMFRVLHPPLRIPWSAIERCERETFFVAFTRTAMYLTEYPHAMRFSGAAGKEIFNVWSRQGTFHSTLPTA